MSNVLKSRNMFLDKEEIVRWDKFIFDDGFEQFIKNSLFQPGILRGSNGSLGSNFLPINGSTYKKIAFTQDSLAYNSNGKRILYKHVAGREFDVPYTVGGTKTSYLSLSYNTSHIETGTITMSNGMVSGGTSGTKFTETLRGQSTLMPSKMRIYSRTTTSGGDGYSYSLVGTYEVVDVISDIQVLLSTDTTLGAGTYVYSVVGAFSPGTFDDSREEEIFEYDNFSLTFSDSQPIVTGTLFLIASITINDIAGTMTITDLRENNLFGINSSVWYDITNQFSFNTTYFNTSGEHFIKRRILQDGSMELKVQLKFKSAAQDQYLELSYDTDTLMNLTCMAGNFHTKIVPRAIQLDATGLAQFGDIIVENGVGSYGFRIYIHLPNVVPVTSNYYDFFIKIPSKY